MNIENTGVNSVIKSVHWDKIAFPCEKQSQSSLEQADTAPITPIISQMPAFFPCCTACSNAEQRITAKNNNNNRIGAVISF